MARYISTKRGLAWGIDLIAAIIVFMFGIVFLYIYAVNFSDQAGNRIDTLRLEGNFLSSLILSEGDPVDWTSSSYVIPGMLSGNRINQTKLDNLYTITYADYNETRRHFRTLYDFYFHFPGTDMDITGNGTVPGIGKPGIDQFNITDVDAPATLIKVNRFTIYNNKPIKMELLIWSKV